MITDYTAYEAATGKIVGQLTCHRAELAKTLELNFGPDVKAIAKRVANVTGFFVDIRKPEIAAIPPAPSEFHTEFDTLKRAWVNPTPAELVERKLRKVQAERARRYPPIGEQLDMLFHAMETGEIPKAKAFVDAIKAVKTSLPKPL